jgi:hypothetical protein
MGGELHYYDECPAWKVVAPAAERFKDVEYRLAFHVFCLPQGALIACWLRLYDIPDQPFFLHRILDVSDARVAEYLERMASSKKLVLLFASSGEQEDFAIDLDLSNSELGEVLRTATEHMQSLAAPDGRAALEAFLAVFDPALKSRGACDLAWDDVDKAFAAPKRPRRELRHARREAEAIVETASLLPTHRGDGEFYANFFKRAFVMLGGDRLSFFAAKWLLFSFLVLVLAVALVALR